MLFTWDTTDLCIIFRQWHVFTTFGLVVSLLGVVILTAGYEFVRESSRRYEVYSAERITKLSSKQPMAAEFLAAQVLGLKMPLTSR